MAGFFGHCIAPSRILYVFSRNINDWRNISGYS
jgi:hypothetical protein